MKHIEDHVPGIKFVQVLEDSDAVIRTSFDHEHPYGKTWSQVGRDAERVSSSQPTINLSDVTGHDSGEIREGSKEYGGIVHELLHALGMQHEHQRPDRPFDISAFAVVSDMDDVWSKRNIIDNIVKRFNPSTIGAFSRPDISSCMNYHIHGEWTGDGTEVKKNNKPSDLDFVWILHPTAQNSSKPCPSRWIPVSTRTPGTRYCNCSIWTENGTGCALKSRVFPTRSSQKGRYGQMTHIFQFISICNIIFV